VEAVRARAAGDRRVLLTFDDGTADLHEHAGLLVARGCAGAVFVPSALLGRTNRWEWPLPGRATRHLTAGELGDLAAAGWEVGLHGATHRDLTRLAVRELDRELAGGRADLEDRLGRPVRWLAYPFGRTDARVVAAAVRAGFTAGFVLTRAPAVGPHGLVRRRRPVYCADGPGDILVKLTDPRGRTVPGRWQLWKEGSAHALGRWTGGWRFLR
jgi:peptidoglycan/xylan/chitin deacetylase (PgdA/CDA1 family)